MDTLASLEADWLTMCRLRPLLYLRGHHTQTNNNQHVVSAALPSLMYSALPRQSLARNTAMCLMSLVISLKQQHDRPDHQRHYLGVSSCVVDRWFRPVYILPICCRISGIRTKPLSSDLRRFSLCTLNISLWSQKLLGVALVWQNMQLYCLPTFTHIFSGPPPV